MSSTPCTHKRRYRQYRIKCDECQSEMNTDYQDIHTKNAHNGKKIKFSPVVDPSQNQLHSFFTRTGTSTRGSDVSEDTVEEDSNRFSKDCTALPEKSIEIQSISHPSVIHKPVTELRDKPKTSNANIDQDQAGQPDVLATEQQQQRIDDLNNLDQEMVCVPPAGTNMVSGNPDTDNFKFESDITERPLVFNTDTSC